jgi:hypothetical protein
LKYCRFKNLHHTQLSSPLFWPLPHPDSPCNREKSYHQREVATSAKDPKIRSRCRIIKMLEKNKMLALENLRLGSPGRKVTVVNIIFFSKIKIYKF